MRKIVGVRRDDAGVTTHVLFKGNQRVVPLEQAVNIARTEGIVNTHVFREEFLRTNPDKRTSNNLDELPEV